MSSRNSSASFLPVEGSVSEVLARWNFLPPAAAADEILPCCASRSWAKGMATRRPLANESSVLAASDDVWLGLTESDWMEAFLSHPRIGESAAADLPDQELPEQEKKPAPSQSAVWSEQEQSNVATADDALKIALAVGNREYERRFRRTFIVCATGKSPTEILSILQRRLANDGPAELREAAEQQRQITHIRLRKWLRS
jgi:2-oxo-4-hydroxy-4-carboxy-5-ureidoimidazoline decarboxylase